MDSHRDRFGHDLAARTMYFLIHGAKLCEPHKRGNKKPPPISG
jgi:hypothetical protein